jgi:hypothetical protein
MGEDATMTKQEALEMLKTAPRDSKPAKINPSITRAQAVEIVENWLNMHPDGKIDPLLKTRVLQVCRNMKRIKKVQP